MAWKISNFAELSLVQSAAVADTTLYVSSTDGSLLPTLGVGDKCKIVLVGGGYTEIVNVTANSSGSLMVERGQESTAARAWAAGTKAIHTVTAEILQTVLNASATIRQTGTSVYSAGTYTVNIGSGVAIPTYTDGLEIEFLIDTTNAVDGLSLVLTNGTSSSTTKAIKYQSLDALEIGDFQASWLALVRYNAANDCWILVSQTSNQIHATQLNDSYVPAVNRHPNGRLSYWSNGTSFSTPSSAAVTADGWYVDYDGSIGTFTVSRQAFTVGQTTVPDNPVYFLRWDHSSAGSGSTYRRLKVPMPNAQWQSGKKISRSIWMKAEAAHNVTAKIVQNFGTGGSPSADVTVNSTVCALTTNWQQFTFEGVSVPSVSGKTFGSNADDALVLYLELPVNVTMTIDVAVEDIRPGDEAGLQSHSFPLPTWMGGWGGSFSSLSTALASSGFSTAFAAAYPDLAAIEALAGTNNIYYRSAANTWTSVTISANLGFSAGTLGSALGTAATQNTGTSGANVPLLNGANSWGATQIPASTTTYDLGDSTHLWNKLFVNSIELGNASDTSITRSSAGVIAVEGNVVAMLNTSQTFAQSQTIATNTSTTATDVLILKPTDYATNKPGLFFSKSSTADQWNISLYDGTTNGGAVQIGATRGLFYNSAIAPTNVLAIGYLGCPMGQSGNAAVTFALTDSGCTIYHDEVTARTYTIPANASIAFPVGTTIVIDNTGNSGAAGTITLNITTDTLRRGDAVSGTGSRTIAAGGVVTIRKTKSTEWVITGSFT